MDKRSMYQKAVWILTLITYAMLYLYPAIPFGSVLVIALSGAIAALTIVIDHNSLRPKITAFHGYVLVFTIFVFASALWAWDRQRAVEMGISLLKTSLVIFLLFFCYLGNSDFSSLLKVVQWGGYLALAAVVALSNPMRVLELVMSSGRIDNTYINANTLGVLAAITLLIHLYDIEQRKKLHWHDAIVLFGVIILAISGSKKALLFLVGGIVLLFAIKGWEQRLSIKKLLIGVIAIIVVIGGMLMLPVFDELRSRMDAMFVALLGKGSESASTSLRMAYMRVGFEQFLKTPLFGIGMDSSCLLAEQMLGRTAYLHCNFVELLACGGIVGFCAYYAIYAYFFVNMFTLGKYRDRFYALILTLGILLLLMDFAQVSYYSRETFFFFMMMYLYVQLLKNRKDTVQ